MVKRYTTQMSYRGAFLPLLGGDIFVTAMGCVFVTVEILYKE